MLRNLKIVAAIATGLVAISDVAGQTLQQPVESMPLVLEAKIPLGDVRGRIDHMAIDLARQRLFVAELGNDGVGVVDLTDRKAIRRISGLSEPQGVGYEPSTDTLFVANARDGSVRLFGGAEYSEGAKIKLGDDADNIRVDAAANRIFVGYGGGALAIFDIASRGKIADIPLKGHPEGFQLSRSGDRIFVNVPNAREIAVIDRQAGKQIASWPMRSAIANFPMALDEEARRVLVMFRNPAKLGVFAMQDGGSLAAIDACGDADDLFVDAKRHRVYVSCGEGGIDVFDAQTYRRTARIPTVPGARTSFFAPEIDCFMLAVRAAAREPAAIWLFRPVP
jgi:DNA-binding beta-propeller fold protein YncE